MDIWEALRTGADANQDEQVIGIPKRTQISLYLKKSYRFVNMKAFSAPVC